MIHSSSILSLLQIAAAIPFLSAAPAEPLPGRVVEVSPHGAISSLAAARDTVRAIRGGGYHGGVTVRIAPGLYPLSEPVVFEPQDGGAAGAPVVYEAAPDTVLFSGGKKITGWKVAPDGLWTTKLDPKWRFEALWINGRRAVRARTPNVNADDIPTSFIVATAQPTEALPGLPLRTDARNSLISIPPEEAKPLGQLSPAELHEVQMVSFHSWDTVRHRLAGVCVEDGVLQTTGAQGFQFFHPLTDAPQRLYLENFRAALDAPGEWFLASDGTLSYKPRPGETLEHAEAYAGVAAQWIILRGDPKTDRLVSHLSFRNLRFAYQAYALPEHGEYNGQAQAPLGAAIEAEGATNVSFENCELAHTMTYAMWLGRGCRDITVSHCWLHDLGAGGVKIGHPEVKEAGPEQTERVTVDNTIIQSCGRYFASGVGILIFSANDCAIRHCAIADLFYSAISIGWTWGYAKTSAGHNLVEDCDLHHIGWGVLSDMGGVYTLGAQPGTVIRGCRVHDLGVAEVAGFGLYNDEGSADVRWENNLVYRAQSSSYHLHYGQRNIVRNNILAFAGDAQLRRTRPETFPAFDFQRNIVIFRDGKLLAPVEGPNWSDGKFSMNHNLYWRTDGAPFDFAGKDFKQWQASGQDADSVVEDPLFANAMADDFRLRPGSPALKLGFVPFDLSKAGVTGDAAWKQIAAAKYPPMIFPDYGALTDKVFDYRTMPAGAIPAHLSQGGKTGAMRIVHGASPARSGLLVTDGPEAQPRWNPYLYYPLHQVRGSTRVVFEFQTGAKMHLLIEGRDTHEPYRVGPRLDFNQGVLYANGKEVWHYPADTSIEVEMTLRLGPATADSYDVTLTAANGETKRLRAVKYDSPDFRELCWFGFISPDEIPASWLLARVEFHSGN